MADNPAPSFEELLTPLLDRAYGVALNLSKRPEEAENLVQEAALRAFRAFHSFQPGTNFRAWFLRILTNCFYEECRKQKSRPTLVGTESGESEEILDHYLMSKVKDMRGQNRFGDPVENFFDKMGIEHISSAIARLPEEFSIAAALYFQEEMAYQEIADILDAPLGTVRSRIHRARKLLQRALWEVAVEEGIVS